jgi:hypothetical protein
LAEKITAEAADTEAPGALELDAWGLDVMGLDKEPDALESGKDLDAMESDAGPKVLCHNLLVWAPLS